VRALTEGPWPVQGLDGLNEETGQVYFSASMRDGVEAPLERRLFRVEIDQPGAPVAVTETSGGFSLNETATAYVTTYSDLDTPPQTGLFSTADGRLIRWIEENRLDQDHPFWPYRERRADPEFGTLESHGETLVWMMTKPYDFDPSKTYPVVMQVYGGPSGGGVKGGWQPATNQLLTEAGYIVFRLDNRGEGYRSARFKQALHLRMGQPEIEDQVLAANYLRSLPYVDDDRIAMMGWSYGGFMSLMALTEPRMGLASAIVGAPPTEWSLYDTHYTERFMSTPEANAEGYAASDAIPRLDNLTGRMLLMHGMADDNVILENSTRVIDALQARSIPFEMMLYPGQRHGVRGQERQLQQWRTYLDFLNRTIGSRAPSGD
jgi:dipeptidyl-peptidase 4